MFIIKSTGLRGPAYPDSTPYTAPDGTRHPRYPRELLEEIAEPVAPLDYSEETYFRNEQDAAPYVVYTRKSDEQLKELHNARVRAEIAALEGSQLMPRATREFMLLSMEAQAPAEVLAEHYGYRVVKAFDSRIAALREQLK
jgi:hypothetical protein